MSELLQGWVNTALAEIGSWCSGGTPSRSKPEYFGKGIPWVKSGDLPDGLILKTDEEITESGLKSSSAKMLPAGTISMALYGATIGKLGIMTFPAATNQACANLIPNENLVAEKYAFFYLFSERQTFIELGQGGAQPNISQEIVRRHPIPLPPLNEQRRIVAKLEEVLAKVDTSQQRLAKIPVILKRFRQAVLAAACSGRLTADWREENKVEEWEWSTLSKQDVSVQTGPFGSALHKHDYVSNGVPLINPMHIREGQIFPNADQSVSETKMKELTRYVLRPGDIVLGRRGEMGRAAVVRAPGLMCGTGSLILRATSKNVVPDFLCLLLRSPYTCAFLEEGSVGSTMTNLNQQVVGSLEFPIVSPEEQQEIVRRVESFFTLADQLEARYRTAKTHVDKLTQSILAKAFRGELVPQDPSDEPAAVLLERIRAERAKTTPAKTKKVRH